jgi:predicted Rdx family selenoprotein
MIQMTVQGGVPKMSSTHCQKLRNYVSPKRSLGENHKVKKIWNML